MKDKFTPNQKESLEDNEVFNLQRFLDAQSHYYEQALREVQDGLKRSHWIWFIFPQLAILGHSYSSCMTLFDAVSPNDVFQKVLDGFYKGQYDLKTLNYM